MTKKPNVKPYSSTDERVLAWVMLRSWGNGRDLACCRIQDLHVTSSADVYVYDVLWREDIARRDEDLVIASVQQCAFELGIPSRKVGAAVRRLTKRNLLRVAWVNSPSWQTKHKIGVGFRATLVHKRILALGPVRRDIQSVDPDRVLMTGLSAQLPSTGVSTAGAFSKRK